MRWLVFYFRSCFCDHKWKLEEAPYEKYNQYISREMPVERNTNVSATCEKCGWHRSYKKVLGGYHDWT